MTKKFIKDKKYSNIGLKKTRIEKFAEVFEMESKKILNNELRWSDYRLKVVSNTEKKKVSFRLYKKDLFKEPIFIKEVLINEYVEADWKMKVNDEKEKVTYIIQRTATNRFNLVVIEWETSILRNYYSRMLDGEQFNYKNKPYYFFYFEDSYEKVLGEEKKNE